MFDKKDTEINNDDFETVVGPSITIEGDFKGKGNILVQGTINGSITTDNNITVEDGAMINASIQAQNAIIAGQVNGNITIQSRLDLLNTSKIIGDIEADVINMEAGAVFNGKSTMRGEGGHEKKDHEKNKKASQEKAHE